MCVDILFECDFNMLPVRLGDYYIYSVAYTANRKPYVKCNKNMKVIKPYVDIMKEVAGKDFKKIDYPVIIEVDIYFKTKAKADLDNRLKCLQDSLMNADIIEDDSLIHELIVRNCGVVKQTGRTVIKITKK